MILKRFSKFAFLYFFDDFLKRKSRLEWFSIDHSPQLVSPKPRISWSIMDEDSQDLINENRSGSTRIDSLSTKLHRMEWDLNAAFNIGWYSSFSWSFLSSISTWTKSSTNPSRFLLIKIYWILVIKMFSPFLFQWRFHLSLICFDSSMNGAVKRWLIIIMQERFLD